jgi:hypothetical protein
LWGRASELAVRGSRATAGALAVSRLSATTAVAFTPPTEPTPDALMNTDKTTAELIADASCWVELSEPLALPASPGWRRPERRRDLRGGRQLLTAVSPKQRP